MTCCAALRCAVLRCAALCVPCRAVPCGAALGGAVPCRAVLCCAALRCAALRCAVLLCCALTMRCWTPKSVSIEEQPLHAAYLPSQVGHESRLLLSGAGDGALLLASFGEIKAVLEKNFHELASARSQSS